jgi:DNA-3-methyladenine glycosylase II
MSRRAHLHLQTDPVMAGIITAVGRFDFKPRLELEPFHSLARAITYQQLNGTVAQSIFNRLTNLFPTRPFAAPAEVLAASDAALRGVGLSYAKIAALKDLAAKTLEGVVPTGAQLAGLGDEEIIERLSSVRGIGRWTVQMMLIFQLGRPDVLPVDDFGVRNGFRLAYGLNGMPLPKALAQFGERWQPYRSIAAWYLWRAVELAREGRLPRCARRPRIAVKPVAKPAVVRGATAKARPSAPARRVAKRTGSQHGASGRSPKAPRRTSPRAA